MSENGSKWIAIIISLAIAFGGILFGSIGMMSAQKNEDLSQRVDVNTLNIHRLDIYMAESNMKLNNIEEIVTRIESRLEQHDSSN